MPWNSDDRRSCSRGCGLRTRAAGLARHERLCFLPFTIERLLEISGADTSDPDGCWIWRGPSAGVKYPLRKRPTRPYVAAYEVTHTMSLIPRMSGREAFDILHRCDNPSCFNPQHLRYDSHAENSLDMSRKGRWKNQYSKDTE